MDVTNIIFIIKLFFFFKLATLNHLVCKKNKIADHYSKNIEFKIPYKIRKKQKQIFTFVFVLINDRKHCLIIQIANSFFNECCD